MDFLKTQLGQVLEQIKMAMVAQTPVVYIPTDQLEVVNDLLYCQDTIDSLVPRVCYDIKDKSIQKLKSGIFGLIDDTGKFTSIVDNYQVGLIDPDSIRIPSILVSYTSELKNIVPSVKNFIAAYLGIKTGKNYSDSKHADAVKRSVCIVVTPKEQTIPADIAPYVKIIRIPGLADEEIETVIQSCLIKEQISSDVIKEQLLSQMIISFRGFSAYSIKQMMNQMIAQQSIDFDFAEPSEIMNTIRTAKKQMLDNSHGLKWEKASVSGVAGLDSITNWLNERTEIFHDPERAVRQHIDIPNGLLISGIPGSGKSLMAKTAATILDMPLISLDMGSLLGGIMGESEHNMINALTMAEQMAPCVLWIDEIEKAFSGSSQSSSSSDGGVGRRMFGKFLTWMQEKSAACFVFATSNDITCLPPELFRSERFDRKFFTFMPTANECAKIFAANIAAQNRSYSKELENMPMRIQAIQAKQLFSPSLEKPEFWLGILNDCSVPVLKTFALKDKNEGKTDSDGNALQPVYVWNSPSRPKNKLMTGADISSLIREAKFKIHPSPGSTDIQNVIYGETQMANAVRSILVGKTFKPYGETNLKDIVKCFLKLHENEFVPASGQCILDFDCFDTDERLYRHEPSMTDVWKNEYDKVLYYTVVGAINHYSKELKNF